MSWPQDGVGGWAPSPRNDSDASARIANAVDRLAWTTSEFEMFGRMCLNTIREPVAPTAEVAGRQSDRDAQHQPDRHRDDPDRQRHPRAHDHPAEHVAAE